MISKGKICTYFKLKNVLFFDALEGFRPFLFDFLYVILFLEASEGFLKLAKVFIHLKKLPHTKRATFLGITHGWFLGDSFCAIINGA
jgi:hypothetical protein